MKTKTRRFIGAIILVAITLVVQRPHDAYGGDTAVPSVGQVFTSAGGTPVVTRSQIAPLSITSGGKAMISLTPVLLPPLGDPTWSTAVTSLLSDAIAGKLTNQVVTNPNQYGLLTYNIGWTNLVYSTSANMWQGSTNTSFNVHGQVIAILVDGISISGGDDLPLDSLGVTAASNDGNVLGASVGFTGMDYTATAPAIKADGSRITSGPTSQKAKRVLVIVYSKLFNVGGTQPGLDSVRNYVTEHFPYRLTFVGQVNGDLATMSRVILTTSSEQPIQPTLMMSRSGVFSAASYEDRSYRLLSSATIIGPWALEGVFNGGNSLTNSSFTGQQKFYRLGVQ